MAASLVSCAASAGGAGADTAQQADNSGETYSSGDSVVGTDGHTLGPGSGSSGAGGFPSCEEQDPLRC